MSDSGELSKSAVYLTADAVERRYGLTRHLLKKRAKPDAWLQSGRTEQKFPLWSQVTIEAYIARKRALSPMGKNLDDLLDEATVNGETEVVRDGAA